MGTSESREVIILRPKEIIYNKDNLPILRIGTNNDNHNFYIAPINGNHFGISSNDTIDKYCRSQSSIFGFGNLFISNLGRPTSAKPLSFFTIQWNILPRDKIIKLFLNNFLNEAYRNFEASYYGYEYKIEYEYEPYSRLSNYPISDKYIDEVYIYIQNELLAAQKNEKHIIPIIKKIWRNIKLRIN